MTAGIAIAGRRHLRRHPETGLAELRTASLPTGRTR
ncbi:hypothetical protein SAMN05443575_3758 [Jatrophihabitans endophyticus]|uniref:Uncharacterized protein n=1 Tax=Jatrophihabitans endophyticus TaxID=1206085 RepID=A0A1M5S7E8_9ACTN|nr:hypothetical protein SAMN05443575_3758 [Jatrophihabitans endophyticus]